MTAQNHKACSWGKRIWSWQRQASSPKRHFGRDEWRGSLASEGSVCRKRAAVQDHPSPIRWRRKCRFICLPVPRRAGAWPRVYRRSAEAPAASVGDPRNAYCATKPLPEGDGCQGARISPPRPQPQSQRSVPRSVTARRPPTNCGRSARCVHMESFPMREYDIMAGQINREPVVAGRSRESSSSDPRSADTPTFTAFLQSSVLLSVFPKLCSS